MTLEEKMQQWAKIRAKIDGLKLAIAPLEEEIKTAVLISGDTVEAKARPLVSEVIVQAKYSKGRGSYNWENIAVRLKPDQEIIDKHSKVTVSWLKVCQAVGYSDELKGQHYTPGTPSVSLKLL